MRLSGFVGEIGIVGNKSGEQQTAYTRDIQPRAAAHQKVIHPLDVRDKIAFHNTLGRSAPMLIDLVLAEKAMTQNWKLQDIPSLSGQVALVTGANSGIGFETALALAQKGAHVVMACRSEERGREAAERLRAREPSASVDLRMLDVSSLQSVEEFAADYLRTYDRLDVFVQNAGIMMVPYATTVDGFETQMATNHLGHFALTGHLLPCIQKSPGARVVTVSSVAHRRGEYPVQDPFYTSGRGYRTFSAYARSKLANLLFAYELQRRFDAYFVDAMALSAHPGFSRTNLFSHLLGGWATRFDTWMGWIAQGPNEGALPSLRAACDPEAKGGDYYGPSGFGEWRGSPVKVKSTRRSHNRQLAEALWQASEAATGVRYLSDELPSAPKMAHAS